MSHLYSDGEAVVIRANERGHVTGFVWQGREHRIERVRQTWRVDSDWWSERGRVWREYHAVTTDDGLLCVLYCDLLTREWRLARTYD